MNSIILTLVGMFVVFCALLLIILCIAIYSRLVRGKAKNNNNQNISVKPDNVEKQVSKNNNFSPADDINPELLAVITAAVAAYMRNSNTAYMVKSIKRVGHTTPIWNVAGRNEYIFSRF